MGLRSVSSAIKHWFMPTIYLFIYLSIYPFLPSFIHSFIPSFIYLFIHPFIHLFNKYTYHIHSNYIHYIYSVLRNGFGGGPGLALHCAPSFFSLFLSDYKTFLRFVKYSPLDSDIEP